MSYGIKKQWGLVVGLIDLLMGESFSDRDFVNLRDHMALRSRSDHQRRQKMIFRKIRSVNSNTKTK